VLIDRFLDDAVEVDVDAVRDHAGEVLIGGVMEHVEEAGVHSGDSACAIPPPSLLPWVIEVIKAYTAAIATRLDVRGLLNVQYAVRGTTVFVIEANPRASRTVPFVAKATGVPLAKVATRVMLGATLAELRDEGMLRPSVLDSDIGVTTVAVKEAVLPFSRFPDVDPALGPEMRSTGEVMGIADFLAGFGEPVDDVVAKVSEVPAGGPDKTAVDLIASGNVAFVVNTPQGSGGRSDGEEIRKAAVVHGVACVTTISAALAAVQGLLEQRDQPLSVRSLQEWHAR